MCRTLRAKNDVKVIFGESYILSTSPNQFDIFESSFVLVLTYGSTFPYLNFLCNLYIESGKNDVQLTFEDSYILCVSKTETFLGIVLLGCTDGTTFL